VTFIAYCWTLMQLLFADECSFKDAVALFVSSSFLEALSGPNDASSVAYLVLKWFHIVCVVLWMSGMLLPPLLCQKLTQSPDLLNNKKYWAT
jgi:hypothetical protein